MCMAVNVIPNHFSSVLEKTLILMSFPFSSVSVREIVSFARQMESESKWI